ncbi:LCP family protein [Embleya sp. NBC_00896]|uniref:LCP family protein n=1 Tax=Embleya sp. NBC_00896 TaxID=2975961 RepID=UPI0038673A9B|nr:LCP family protein [Embleya sp. NBC_00896]
MGSWDHLYRPEGTTEPDTPAPQVPPVSVETRPVSASGRAAARRARKKRNRRRKVFIPIGVGVSIVLLTGVSAAYVAYQRFNGNLRTDSVGDKLNADRPDVGGNGTGKPMNLLIIGSDSRAGGNRALGGGGDNGERSDTTLFVHLSSDRRHAVVMSIPRDLLVTVPSCVARDGTRSVEQRGAMFNSAFELGGAACTRNTVEKVTEMRVDHHIIVDFSGFKGMVDAVGGVEICLPRNVQDHQGNISLSAGRRKVHGREALDYVRLRHDIGLGGDGSDLGRIKRQQAFVASLAKQIRSSDTLTDPSKVFALADALTKSIRADEGLDSVKDLVELARGMSDLETKDITFAHVPVYNPPENPNRVALVQPESRRLFDAINHDEPLDGRRRVAPPSAGASAAGAPARQSAGTVGADAGSDPAAAASEPPKAPVRAGTRDADQDICKAN